MFAVSFGVSLRGFRGVVGSVMKVGLGNMSVVSSGVMITRFVMRSGLAMMMSGLFVMFRSFFMVFDGVFGHGCASLSEMRWAGSGGPYAQLINMK